eukprot:CAMPEP_0170550538 /NCGR_PEP_ID=MMETSP0211-20121228/8603_1 /TAXON_ID=311385 /ORGANISM="Pseudokeronopsis sp., Strain OXSARD2" /LENGTH=115 /DNA_ID=CAMNT_0010857155 /DNA_START=319 /DNA_END=663 /DNA_ORIENTATION=+
MKNLPNEGNFKANLEGKGFTDGEIVAIASLESFGILNNPEKAAYTKYPKLDNYYYKQVLSATSDKHPKYSDQLLADPSLKEFTEKFAESEKAFKGELGSALRKMSVLGHEELTPL